MRPSAAAMAGYGGGASAVPAPTELAQGAKGRAVVVINHRASMYPEGQINVRVRDIVQVFDDDYGSQWWTVQREGGTERGQVPMTSLEMLEDTDGKVMGEVGTGYAAPGAGGANAVHRKHEAAPVGLKPITSMSNEWSGGFVTNTLKLFKMINYNEWSKHCTVGCAMTIYVQGISVAFWNFKEGSRPTGSLAEAFGQEVSGMHVAVAVAAMIGYTLFMVYERSVGPKDVSWREREKAPGPSIMLRMLVHLVLGAGLLIAQPTMLAGCTTTLLGLVCTGAFLKKEKSTCYTAEQNPIPLLSRLRLCFQKKENRDQDKKDDDADAEDAKEMEPSWLQRQKQMDRLGKLVFMLIYVIVNTVLFIEAANRAHRGVKANCIATALNPTLDLCLSTTWIPVAKGCGQLLNLNCALIAVPVLTEVMRYLNQVKVGDSGRNEESNQKTLDKWVPLGKNITFHRYVAWMILVNVIVHTIAHYINYSTNASSTTKAFMIKDGLGNLWPSKGRIGGLSVAWATGIGIICCMMLMYSAAQESVKRQCFNTFWFSHHLFYLFWGQLFIHGGVFWAWGCVPIGMYIVGRVQRGRNTVQKVILEEVVIEPPNVVKLVMCNRLNTATNKRELFHYDSGMYVKINCPFIAPVEWHPFTISSAPEGPHLTVHIKVTRPTSWTGKLKKFLSQFNPQGMKTHVFYSAQRTQVGCWKAPLEDEDLPLIKVDGPHPAPCQHIAEFKDVILVGAGIGLTPFSSTLSSLVDHKWLMAAEPSKVFLHWSFRMSEFSNFAWFVRLIAEVRARFLSTKHVNAAFKDHVLEIYLYDTSRGLDDAKKLKNAQAMLSTACSVTPTATYDRNQQILVEAVQAVPSPDDPAVAPSALMFDRGDKIELISSTRTCALAEGAEYLHGKVLSTRNVQYGSKVGYFPANRVKSLQGADMSVEPQEERSNNGLPGIPNAGKGGGYDRGMIHCRFGRPVWDLVFPEMRAKCAGRNIGVFCCGPMGKALRAACMKYSLIIDPQAPNKPDGKPGSTIFKLHAEVF